MTDLVVMALFFRLDKKYNVDFFNILSTLHTPHTAKTATTTK
jgi:hypothetical protein